MKVSQSGVALIKRFEGLELEAYQDIAGVWTIGFGHTETARAGMKISEREAEELLRQDLKPRERAVDELTRVPLNQNEFDALVSFVYNVGIAGYRGSTARRRLNNGDRSGAAQALTWWNKATVSGVLREVTGLTRRRAAERALFLEPVNPPIVNNPEDVNENSRVAPVEDAPRRPNLAESRSIQGATVAGGAGVAASTIGRDSAGELNDLETNIENGEGLTEDADEPGGLARDPDGGTPDDANAPITDPPAIDDPGELAGGDPAPGEEPAGDGPAVVDPDTDGQSVETPSIDSGEMVETIEMAPERPSKHEKHQTDEQIQLALLILIVLAVVFIIFARIDDWWTYRR